MILPKLEKDVLVINRKILFADEKDVFQGFKMHYDADFQSRIKSSSEYIKRKFAEKDESFKQPVNYALILNPKTKKVYAYQRTKSGLNYTEKRLQHKWSVGIGGHVDRDEEKESDPVYAGLIRELHEEVKIKDYTVKILGYINEDRDSVGRVHFGVVYLILTEDIVCPNAEDCLSGSMKSIEEIKQITNAENAALESWSVIALDFLEKNISEITQNC